MRQYSTYSRQLYCQYTGGPGKCASIQHTVDSYIVSIQQDRENAPVFNTQQTAVLSVYSRTGKTRQYSTYSRQLYCQYKVGPNNGSDVADDTVGWASVTVTFAFVLYGENSEQKRYRARRKTKSNDKEEKNYVVLIVSQNRETNATVIYLNRYFVRY